MKMEDERREDGGEVEGERERPQERDRNRITEKGYLLQELIGQHHGSNDMVERVHHQDE